MDGIDSWMNRIFKGKKTSQNSSNKPQQKKKDSSPKPKKGRGAKPGKPAKAGKPHHSKGKNHAKGPKRSHRGKKPAAKPVLKKNNTFEKGKLKVIPLGGLNEVGKNMMALEYEEDIIIIDMGFEFPSEDMLGIDYVIPDVTYLEERKHRIRGVLLTHGHLDHIGGVSYVLPKLGFPPVYAGKLTMGLVQKRIEEFKQTKLAKLHVIDPTKPLKLGKFRCEFFRVLHSIPDSFGIIVDSPIGKVVHTGDFKFDENPARNLDPADIPRMEKLGSENVLALFCESTNALKPGHSMSEKEVGETLGKIVAETEGRLIIASFSSQIGRIQQILDAALKNNRKVFVSGRSMRENISIAAKLGYLKLKKGDIMDIKKYKNSTPDNQTLILTTGSQGEAVSALTRMSMKDHSSITVKKGDTIVLSSSPIIGNEKAINTVINNLTIIGADVIHNQMRDVHTSGHGKQDELARMINYVKPKYLIPIHGEYYMRKGLVKLAGEKCNIPEERTIMLENGDVILADREKVLLSKEKVETKYILIDGLGEGHIGSRVQVDREIMSQNGALIVLVYVNKKSRKLIGHPEVVSRGFIYMHESNEVMAEIAQIAKDAYKRIRDKNPGAERKDVKRYIRQTVDKHTHSKLERRPLIIPLIIES